MFTTTKSWIADWNGRQIAIVNKAGLFSTKGQTEISVDGRKLNVNTRENNALTSVRDRMREAKARKTGNLMSVVRESIAQAREGAGATAKFMHDKKRHTILAKIKPSGLFGFACLILVDKTVIGGDTDAFDT